MRCLLCGPGSAKQYFILHRARDKHSTMTGRTHPFTRSTFATTALARNCAMMALRCLRS